MAPPPIHSAAFDGRLAEVNRLLEEDPRLLNARDDDRCTPLIHAACQGHDAVVTRLLQLGADVDARNESGDTVAHLACYYNKASTLALLLDAGASINARAEGGHTLLMAAALIGATTCLRLLLARGGPALELDAQMNDEWTALHLMPYWATPECVRMLLAAGADPTIRSHLGKTPLDLVRQGQWEAEQWEAEQWESEVRKKQAASRVALLEAVMVCEPECPRLLLKARALLDTARTIHHIQSGGDDGQRRQGDAAPLRKRTRAESHRKALAATPAYLKGRVKDGEELPRVVVVEEEDEEEDDEKLLGCLQYALGLKGGGAVHEEGEGPPPQGMVWEVFVELCELLAPKWARKDM